MKISTELFEEDVRELAEKANIDKPGLLIQFLYHRARGLPNTEIEELVSVSRRTFQNWEDKLEDNLNQVEESELVAKAVVVEHDKRYDRGEEE